MENFIIIGQRGSGKTTQSTLVAEYYGLTHLNYSLYVQAQINEQTELGCKALQFTRAEKRVPDALVVDMYEMLIAAAPQNKGYVFDGFPTSVEGAAALELMLKRYRIRVRNVFNLTCLYGNCSERYERKGYRADELQLDRNKGAGQVLGDYSARAGRVEDFYRHKHEYRAINGDGDADVVFSEIKKVILGIR